MKFKKETLQAMVFGDLEDGYEVVEDKITSHGRWSVYHTMIFKLNDRLFSTDYSTGATESQDELPYQYASDEIECPEVSPVEKTIIVYEPIATQPTEGEG